MKRDKRTKKEIMQGRDGELWVFCNSLSGINKAYHTWDASDDIYLTADKYYAFRRQVAYSPNYYEDY